MIRSRGGIGQIFILGYNIFKQRFVNLEIVSLLFKRDSENPLLSIASGIKSGSILIML